MNIVILGLSITSSWGNGHATTYRGLVRELTRRGHRVLFLERDKPWYAQNRDMPRPPFGVTRLYRRSMSARLGRSAFVRQFAETLTPSGRPPARRILRAVHASSEAIETMNRSSGVGASA